VERLYRSPRQRGPERLAEPYLIGNSLKIKEIREDIKKVCNTDMTVLVLGETGAGKGILARSLHNNSTRRDKPFVEVNCANIPQSLMESEFFGYKRGAFTGAWQNKTGKFELASSGTIFLDEISEMSRNMQAKLLQVLQEGEFSPVGGMDNVQVNVRVIAATNMDPGQLVSSGDFRLDLYYRLAVLRFHLPSLKERKEDILPLSMFFLEKYARQYEKRFTTPTPRLWRMLEEHDWPGNVRELENTIRTLVALENENIVIEEMAKKMKGKGNPGPAEPAERGGEERDIRSMTLREITEREIASAEKNIISRVLRKTNGNKKKAAELLQVSYKCILNKVKTYGL
jgi:transcriptional regulator with PAS, ATPase and Fis domain